MPSTASVDDTSSWTNSAPAGTFSLNPPERSSTTTTSWPRLRQASATCDPMKPAPPETRLRGTPLGADARLLDLAGNPRVGLLYSRQQVEARPPSRRFNAGVAEIA